LETVKVAVATSESIHPVLVAIALRVSVEGTLIGPEYKKPVDLVGVDPSVV